MFIKRCSLPQGRSGRTLAQNLLGVLTDGRCRPDSRGWADRRCGRAWMPSRCRRSPRSWRGCWANDAGSHDRISVREPARRPPVQKRGPIDDGHRSPLELRFSQQRSKGRAVGPHSCGGRGRGRLGARAGAPIRSGGGSAALRHVASPTRTRRGRRPTSL